ncbi:Golgi transport complex subunit 7 [Coemansia sp. RSA 1285]|nr:Golgi transport complex subunit 7 [Coemansia sp. RSA 1285]
MEVRLDAFSSTDFNVKEWLNQQFASLDAAEAFGTGGTLQAQTQKQQNASESITQRLTTQLHILATNAQQGSDRIKARFRHQAAQITRDIAALARLIGDTQKHMAGLTAEIEAQQPAARAVENLVHIGTARHRLQRSVAALDHLRSYTDLPQKINTLIEDGDLAQAWRLVDSIEVDADGRGERRKGSAGPESDASAIGLSETADIEQYKERVAKAAMDRLEKAVREQNAETASELGRLLASHSHGSKVEQVLVKIRADSGMERLQPALDSLASDGDIGDILELVADLVEQDRVFIDAADEQASAAVLTEQLLTVYVEAMHPTIVAKVDGFQKKTTNSSSDDENETGSDDMASAAVLDLYQALVRFYSGIAETLRAQGGLSVGASMLDAETVLLQPVPRSLQLVFEPFVQFMRSGLADCHVEAIRTGSLRRLARVADLGLSSGEIFTREAPECILEVFLDVDRAISRTFTFVPPSALPAAVSGVAGLVSDVARIIAGRLDAIANRCGIPALAFADPTALVLPLASSSAIRQPLASEDKLMTVSAIVGVSIASRLFDQCATALLSSIARRWEELVGVLERRYLSGEGATEDNATTMQLGALMEVCTTPAEMVAMASRLVKATEKEPPGIGTISDALSMVGRRTASAVVYTLAAPFSAPLVRIPQLRAWHSERESVSSMNIHVPLFSCSPSEEAVDIGEKMHILLPELEQVEAIDQQALRVAHMGGEEDELQSLFAHIITWLPSTAGLQEGLVDALAPPIQNMLSLVLAVVLRCICRQICSIEPPLSASGHEQLLADIDYIASVVASFTSPSCQEFDVVRRCLLRSSDSEQETSVNEAEAEAEAGLDAESEAAVQTRKKMKALLAQQQPPS